MLHKMYGDELVMQPYIMSVDALNARDTSGICLWLKSCAQLATRRICSDSPKHYRLAASTRCLIRVHMLFSIAVSRCCLVKVIVVTPTILNMVAVINNNEYSINSEIAMLLLITTKVMIPMMIKVLTSTRLTNITMMMILSKSHKYCCDSRDDDYCNQVPKNNISQQVLAVCDKSLVLIGLHVLGNTVGICDVKT